MKLLFVKALLAGLALAGGFAATPAFAGHVLDLQVLGRGSVNNDCDLAVTLVGCNVLLAGQASGTHIGHDDFAVNLRVTTASTRSSNGVGGLCAVVTGTLTLTPPSAGTSINMNVAGTICEEGGANSPAEFDGTYRITGGSARFADAVGGGSLALTWLRGAGGLTFLHLHGTID